ncbi:TIC56 [Scenedesmus sp. PABB004]|nr:TIC56 [Scenedesmus sp. PABB004]
MADPAAPGGGPAGEGEALRKVRVHKVRARAPVAVSQSGRAAAAMDARIAEIVPGLAELSLGPTDKAGARAAAAELRASRLAAESALAKELLELDDIYDFSQPHPVDSARPAGPWSQKLKPKARSIKLSPYQYEMINYQRMLLRKNIWYYRDRMSVPRGPCPLHVLKDCWVQGVIDENTLVWGQGLIDWLPMRNVKLLVAQVRTPEVRFGAWVKRTFSLKPALERIREGRREARNPEQQSQQVERMR